MRFEADYSGLMHFTTAECVVEVEVVEDKVIEVPDNSTISTNSTDAKKDSDSKDKAADAKSEKDESADEKKSEKDESADEKKSEEKAEADKEGADKDGEKAEKGGWLVPAGWADCTPVAHTSLGLKLGLRRRGVGRASSACRSSRKRLAQEPAFHCSTCAIC